MAYYLVWKLLLILVASASLLKRSHAQWVQTGNLLRGTGGSGSAFRGTSVALNAGGDVLAVGGSGDTTNIGAVWVFTWNGTVWRQQGSKLVGSGGTGTIGRQGSAVALNAAGDVLAVGGNRDNSDMGAAWVWSFNGTAWNQVGDKLVGSGGSQSEQGSSVALNADGTLLAVGGPKDNVSGFPFGAVWIWSFNGTAWNQVGNKLVGSGGSRSEQGSSVALNAEGDVLAFGGIADGGGRGAAWVSAWNGTAWNQQGSKLVGSDLLNFPKQGQAVALNAAGNVIAVGGPNDNNNIGATWMWSFNGSAWNQEGGKLVGAGITGTRSSQGSSVALNAAGNVLVVGGPGDNYNTVSITSIGATWTFVNNGSAWNQEGSKVVGTGSASTNQRQGQSVALNANASVLAVGAPSDGSNSGATWMFTSSFSPPATPSISPSQAPVTSSPSMAPTLQPTFQDSIPAGTNVTVPISNSGGSTQVGVLTFASVSTLGTLTVVPLPPSSPSAASLPSGQQFGNPPAYYNISTTATYSGSILVCLIYPADSFPLPYFNNPKLIHYDVNAWVDITQTVDTASRQVCGTVTHFSDFGVTFGDGLSSASFADPHLVGAMGTKYDFDGQAEGTYVLFSAPQFQITMTLSDDDGPGSRFMTEIGLMFRNQSFSFNAVDMSLAFLDDLEERLGQAGGRLLSRAYWQVKMELCPNVLVIISQMHTTEPWFAHADGTPWYYVDVGVVLVDCHDSYDGPLGQTYKCKYVRGEEAFVWSHEQEESFRIPDLFTATGSFQVDAPCFGEDEEVGKE